MIRIAGSPSGPQPGSRAGTWRARVAEHAAGQATAPGLALEFTLEPGRWIDLDTLVQNTVGGLRDAGMYRRGLRDLDAVRATKQFVGEPALTITPVTAGWLSWEAPPGPVRLDVANPMLVRAGDLFSKRRWRDVIAGAWRGARPLAGPVWADVVLRTGGSLLGSLEPTLDALEPCLGRDPRGRPWQEFFPRDDLIQWLRVRRDTDAENALRLRLGPGGGS